MTIDKLIRVVRRYFPDRQILIRSRAGLVHLDVSSRMQLGIVLAIGIVGLGSGSVAVVRWPSILGLARTASGDSLADPAVDALKLQLAQARSAQENAQLRLQSAIDDRRRQLGDPDGRVHLDTALVADQMRRLEADLQQADQHGAETRSLYEKTAKDLARVEAEQRGLLAEKKKLEAEIARMAHIQAEAEQARQKEARARRVAAADTKPDHAATGGADPDSPASAVTASAAGDFPLRKLLKQLGMRVPDEGGPFLALGSVGNAGKPDPQAIKLLRTLPLSAPLDHYQLESGFGARIDPINGRESFHPGLDMSAPYRTPVYSTAPGIVVSAGWAGEYGRMVEIDHGHGIHTRYAHLNRIMVNVGQKLTRRTRIGLLGSTGRVTGPHVHYEVDVNGTPENPEMFLRAGHSVVLVHQAE